ncbi:acyl-CoA dehydrogenase family protein [Rhodococcus sp. NPDC058505]|uniref:acyl-CoA dehydrogenase family protein n=1 Tax=Rhodococcus sp. NPDC058505 TaxID=3346531 RepID=UPI00365FC744
MSADLDDLTRLLDRVFDKAGARTGFDPALWSTLSDLGVTRLTGAEAGGGWPEAAVLLAAAGASAAPVPLAENDLLAGWLADSAELPGGDTPIRTAAVVDGSGVAHRVPWARHADALVVVWPDGDGHRVAQVPRAGVDVVPGANLAGEPRDRVTVDPSGLAGVAIPGTVVRELQLRGALARALAMTGAAGRVLDIVVGHTTTRTQFGRPIAAFQAVQQLVADIAAADALARAATEAAVSTVMENGFDAAATEFAIASARSCAGHAAATIVRNAHQAMGAIGFTAEHPLHRYTNRLLAWRGEFGSVRSWDDAVTGAAAGAGGAGLWPLISGTGAP